MKKRTYISNATIVNEGEVFNGTLVIEDDRIAEIIRSKGIPTNGHYINAEGCFLLPGIIDDHVHFRDPGLTHKATIESESRAAAAGGVTSYFDMPNTVPQTTTLETLEAKRKHASEASIVNYSFFFGATNDNLDLIPMLDRQRTCGIKVFMGSSTGNMLVDNTKILLRLFQTATLPIMTHCEDSNIIAENLVRYQQSYGKDPDVRFHPHIRSTEACYRSTALAVQLAKETHARLHIAHITTSKELELIPAHNKHITAEACMAHLLFCNEDYATLGTRIKCNPAIKTRKDREALRKSLNTGKIQVIGTDHAPHLLSEKQGGCVQASSGMPMIQFSLVSALELVDQNIIDICQLVTLMCHNPATLFHIKERGFLRKGYKADLVLVRPHTPWTLTRGLIESKCQWSPLEGHRFKWQIESTFCNGQCVYNRHKGITNTAAGEEIEFER